MGRSGRVDPNIKEAQKIRLSPFILHTVKQPNTKVNSDHNSMQFLNWIIQKFNLSCRLISLLFLFPIDISQQIPRNLPNIDLASDPKKWLLSPNCTSIYLLSTFLNQKTYLCILTLCKSTINLFPPPNDIYPYIKLRIQLFTMLNNFFPNSCKVFPGDASKAAQWYSKLILHLMAPTSHMGTSLCPSCSISDAASACDLEKHWKMSHPLNPCTQV